MQSTKKLVDRDSMAESLINLREELRKRDVYREIVFKINSCLYNKYPTK